MICSTTKAKCSVHIHYETMCFAPQIAREPYSWCIHMNKKFAFAAIVKVQYQVQPVLLSLHPTHTAVDTPTNGF
jgi:hypothetical protein